MKKKKIITMAATLTMAAFLLMGCSNQEKSQAEVVPESTPVQESSTKQSMTSVIPVGEKQESESMRVVASSVAVVEILDALGVPMIGVPTSSYELPESVADAQKIGNPMSPDMEVIASLEPSVIVSVDSLSDELKSQFETLSAESCFVNLSGYDGLKETIKSLGDRFSVQEKAAALIQTMEEKEAALQQKISGKESPSVLIVFGANTSFMVASEDTYVGDLVKRAGGENIMTDAKSAFSPVDMEYLADKNPDYILFMAHANPEESLEAFKKEFDTNEAWQNFDAVTKDNVYALETGLFGMSANLLAPDAMDRLADILYGEN